MAETPRQDTPPGRPIKQGLLWWALLALTIVLTVALQAVNAPLKTPAAPQGIVSYEFAGTITAAQSILDSWDAGAKIHAGFSLGNVQTHANLGGMLRLGFNLPSDFGVQLIRPGGGGNSPINDEDPRVSLTLMRLSQKQEDKGIFLIGTLQRLDGSGRVPEVIGDVSAQVGQLRLLSGVRSLFDQGPHRTDVPHLQPAPRLAA